MIKKKLMADKPLCDFCEEVPAVVYCKSDAAQLCLQCDGCVHSANCLSRKHLRSLICDKCNSQPAVVRCLDDGLCFCQVCDNSFSGNCSRLGHHRQKLSFYSGCPSPEEFSKIWSSVLDSCNSDDGLVMVDGKIEIGGASPSGCGGIVANRLSAMASCAKFDSWAFPPPVPFPLPPNLMPSQVWDQKFYSFNRSDQAPLFSQTTTQKKGFAGSVQDLWFHESDDLSDGFDMDEMSLNFDSGCEMLENLQNQGLKLRSNGGLRMEKNLSVTGSNSTHIENTLEASSSGQQDCMCLPTTSANLIQTRNMNSGCMLTNPNICHGLASGQLPTSVSLSLSNITGESSAAAADYQDCGLSSTLFLTGDSPWDSNFEPSCPQARDKAKMRYNEKKKTRMFGKQIRYASRKARADT